MGGCECAVGVGVGVGVRVRVRAGARILDVFVYGVPQGKRGIRCSANNGMGHIRFMLRVHSQQNRFGNVRSSLFYWDVQAQIQKTSKLSIQTEPPL